jgi:hypothetical protein
MDSGDSTRFQKQKTAEHDGSLYAAENVELKNLSILIAEDNALDRSLTPETSSHDPSSITKGREPVTSAALPDPKGLTIEPADDVFTPKYVEDEITTASDISGLAMHSGDSNISETDATSSTDLLRGGEVGPPDSSLYLLARMAGAETDGFSGATRSAVNAEIENASNIEIDGACDIAIEPAEKLVIADSDENVTRELNQSAEIISVLPCIEASYGNSDDSGPPANARLSAPAGLAILQAISQLTQESPSLAKQDEGPTRTAGWDPFEQARKSLSKSRFDVRVIHNDGDPSDRNLI